MEISVRSVDYNGGNYVPGVRHEMTLEIDLTDIDNDPSFDVTVADEAEFELTFSVVDVDVTSASGVVEELPAVTVQLTDVNTIVNDDENATTVIPPAGVRQFIAVVSVGHASHNFALYLYNFFINLKYKLRTRNFLQIHI